MITIMKRGSRAWVVALLAVAATVAFSFAHAQEAPDALVKRVSQDMLATIKGDPLVQAGNEARIREGGCDSRGDGE